MAIPVAESAPDMSVNKGELAEILGVTAATVTAWTKRHPDFPAIERGAQGREWRFDPVAVLAFVEGLRAAEKAAEAERGAALSQLGLALVDPGDAARAGAEFTLDDIRRVQLADRLRTERGYLVPAHDLAGVLAGALARWDRRMAALVLDATRSLNLPQAAAEALAARLVEATQRFAAEAAGDGLAMPAQGELGGGRE